METYGINPELHRMVKEGLLGERKLEALREIRSFVNRLASTRFVSVAEAEKIRQKTGVLPDILTWGDYFQTEIASRDFDLSDSDFLRIIDTVKFDLISAVLIFQEKPVSFILEAREAELPLSARDTLTEEEEEALHLSILARYYQELGLEKSVLSETDEIWFHGFVNMQQKSVG